MKYRGPHAVRLFLHFFATLAVAVSVLGPVPAAARPPVIKVTVMRDGTLEINGRRYRDDASFGTKIRELAAEKPRPSFVVVTEKPSTMDQVKLVGKLIGILQEAGVARFGFLIEPERN